MRRCHLLRRQLWSSSTNRCKRRTMVAAGSLWWVLNFGHWWRSATFHLCTINSNVQICKHVVYPFSYWRTSATSVLRCQQLKCVFSNCPWSLNIQVSQSLALDRVRGRPWHIAATCGLNGSGVGEGVEWLAGMIRQTNETNLRENWNVWLLYKVRSKDSRADLPIPVGIVFSMIIAHICKPQVISSSTIVQTFRWKNYAHSYDQKPDVNILHVLRFFKCYVYTDLLSHTFKTQIKSCAVFLASQQYKNYLANVVFLPLIARFCMQHCVKTVQFVFSPETFYLQSQT